MRPSLLTVLAVVALASLPVRAAGMDAQTGPWVIGPIGAAAPDGKKFCSMKNGFANGHTLVFAREAGGANSVAVDFGEETLRAGKQYRVTLDLPPVLTREMTAVAATRQVLLVSMGRDEAFYDALARMKALYLTAQGHDHAYSLAGTGEALRELKECARALGEGRSYAQAASMPAVPVPAVMPAPLPAPAEEGEGVNEELRRLRAENKILRRQSEAMQAEAIAATVRKDDVEAARIAAETLAQRQQRMEAENIALQKALADLQTALVRQNKLVEEVRGAQEQRQQAAEAERARLAAELAVLQEKLAKQEALVSETRTGDAGARAALEEENRKLKEALAAIGDNLERQRAGAARAVENPAPVPGVAPEPVKETVAEEAPAPAARVEKVLLPRRRPAAPRPALAEAGRREAEKLETGLEKILGASGIAAKGGLSARTVGGAKVYSWQSDGLYGSAESSAVSGGAFNERVGAWFARMSRRCKGDFAKTAQQPRRHGATTTQKAEMACIGDEGSAAAALLFVDDGKSFTVVMQEGATGQMQDAIEKRDAVAAAVARAE